MAAALPIARFLRLGRVADDSGRFMLADLRSAEPATLADLLVGLAPFTTGVVMDPDDTHAVWRRYGSAHIGRIDAVTSADDAALAAATAADAVLGSHDLEGLPRFGADPSSDIGLDVAGRYGTIWTTDDPGVVVARGGAGFVVPVRFWRDPLAGLTSADRRRTIADVLVPRLQAVTAVTADLPMAVWRES